MPQLFANVASAGVSASSGRYVGPTKRLGARVAYSAATVAAFASYRPPTLRLRRMGVGDAPGDVDGHAGAGAEAALEEVVESVTALAVCNGQYFGGGFRIAPDADAGDGLLDAVGLQGFGLLEFARLGGFLRRGEHMGIEGVSMRRSSALLVEVAEEDEGTGRAHSCVLRSPILRKARPWSPKRRLLLQGLRKRGRHGRTPLLAAVTNRSAPCVDAINQECTRRSGLFCRSPRW